MEEQSKANANIEKLNSEQRYAVYKVLHAIYEYQTDMSKCFFLDGPAGTGKTFVYSTLLHAVRGKGDQAIAVASTGIAATLLSGGRTAHSTASQISFSHFYVNSITKISSGNSTGVHVIGLLCTAISLVYNRILK
ncbi:hypothetical protein AVEN_199711-1 [Araneus ventricosus]|uniref:ATP-dependent DNA helicase n=1 Tax=Araneus ventricosus TaxID=182803 RepID=A0A4Y2GW46_ARAVE|nr:hypothetical protein AVEN_199711-1 [Araneus ventricosus]